MNSDKQHFGHDDLKCGESAVGRHARDEPSNGSGQPLETECPQSPPPRDIKCQGQFSREIYDSPDESSSYSDESMNNHIDDATPPDPLVKAESPGAAGAVAKIDQLSIEHGNQHPAPAAPSVGRGMLAACSIVPSQRHSRKSPGSHIHTGGRPIDVRQPTRRYMGSHRYDTRASPKGSKYSAAHSHGVHKAFGSAALHKDSGYETGHSRSNTKQHSLPGTSKSHEKIADPSMNYNPNSLTSQSTSRYPGLLQPPKSSPISQDQLGEEIKGIYAGLVMVEAKSISIDAAYAADPTSKLPPEQWQALIALHRTLLYEHHDFLMATQHPSATPSLRGLAVKYNMPARMWKHGIHAFLEVLRHRRPESQEYMLGFIYLAYQMMALLYETVRSFTDTWIECLGDLARYRMAIEEEKEAHITWGGVAARWYTIASDRHPAIGRLYHHLGILERPILRKFCLYAKSLTSVVPFPNARDSLSTLCMSINSVENGSNQSAEARTVTFHALIYSDKDLLMTESIAADALHLIPLQLPRLRNIGSHLAVANIAAMFQLGNPSNIFGQLYAAGYSQPVRNTRPTDVPLDLGQLRDSLATFTPSPSLLLTIKFCYSSFNTIAKHYDDESALQDCLPFVHVMLAWFHSLQILRGRLNEHHHTFSSLIDSQRVDWSGLTDFLNSLLSHYAMSARVFEKARQGVFLATERKDNDQPLTEDYLIQGLVWVQSYFSLDWFDGQTEDEGRAIESPIMQSARAERVLWLGLYLAFHTEHIGYNVGAGVFSTSAVVGPSTKVATAVPRSVNMEMDATDSCSEHVVCADSTGPPSRSSAERSTDSSHSEDGFHIVKSPLAAEVTPSVETAQTPEVSPSWTKVNADKSRSQKYQKQNMDAFKEGEDNGMDLESEEALELRSPSQNLIRRGFVDSR